MTSTQSPSRRAITPNIAKQLSDKLYKLTSVSFKQSPALEQFLQDVLAVLRELLASGDFTAAGDLAAAAKALRVPLRDLDMLRAYIFLGLGQPIAAYEAIKEELRYFPDNDDARQVLGQLETTTSREHGEIDPELASILPIIRPYTMVGLPRLQSLFTLAKKTCLNDIPGDFAECGVAAGGASALLAFVLKRYSQRPRVLYCFDTFSGMPDPGPLDKHRGVQAQESGWGAGTCAAPMESLLEVCRRLDLEALIRPVQGVFSETLPEAARTINSLSMLHLDGDWYASTMDILMHFYDLTSPGASIQVDDYGFWEGCDQALGDFMESRGERISLQRIQGGVGAFFFKS